MRLSDHTESFKKRILGRIKVSPEPEPVSFDPASERRKSRGKLIESGIKPFSGGILGLRISIQKDCIDFPVIVSRNLSAEIAVHCQMVAAEHNSGVLIKILLLYPSDEFRDLSARAGNSIRVVVVRIVFPAQAAFISVFKVCIYSQKREIEWLVSLRQFCDPVLCSGKKRAKGTRKVLTNTEIWKEQ